MATRKPIFQDPELPIHSGIETEKKNWTEIEKLATETFNLDHNGKAEKAKSNKASGRNCPRCASIMRVKEETDNGTVILICWHCKSEWHNTELEQAYTTDDNGKVIVDPMTDSMFRRIDQSTINHWMAYFEKYKKKD